MLVDSDWSLESLQAHHGTQMAYRVSQQETTVRVEGRAGWKTCLLKTAKPDGVARLLLRSPALLSGGDPTSSTSRAICFSKPALIPTPGYNREACVRPRRSPGVSSR